MSIKDTIRNTMLTSNVPLSFDSREPKQYADRQHEYYEDSTLWFIDQYARYSSDYVEAQIQGLDPEKPFEYTTVHIRLADVITESASMTAQIDNWKNIKIAEKEYTYLRKGAKVITMGSTWLVVNPVNLSSGDGQGLIQRCNALWHYLDYYGNVLTEPMAVGDDGLRATDPDAQRSVMIAKGYFIAKMQYNEVTKTLLNNNSRMILGSGAYHLTGYMNFLQEFTSVEESTNLLKFIMRFEEPIEAIDDLEKQVAGGKTFKWEILMDGKHTMLAGGKTRLTATSRRTNENHSEIVQSTEEYPITYEWSSSDESVCTVDSDGNVTAVGEGSAVITATLVQNPAIQTGYQISVVGVSAEPHIEFNTTIPDGIRIYEKLIVAATYYENGEATEQQLTWELSGADPSTYSYVVEKVYETSDGTYTTELENHEYETAAARNGIVIKCWGGSVKDLEIKASYGDASATTTISLIGL